MENVMHVEEIHSFDFFLKRPLNRPFCSSLDLSFLWKLMPGFDSFSLLLLRFGLYVKWQ